ncbi:TVP38/TMEM64 family protein [Halomicroarcula limicola]|uniref:TVP38/TMEM64 family protein n=1 Tax=Haloarcula limicola TaxID=1429915 RepID=A0A8J8C524_9EURY|nr:TVP38/TMEM64 family protein [Halomicroarcula limicola]MBV0926276.1 TVP38/TMEM64 family protein [Halomicroarcula limicola]
MRVFSSRAALWRGVVGLVFLTIAFVAAYLGARQYAPFIFDAQALREWISQFGVFAPLVFVLLQALQVIVAPIPGQILALVAGYLFGPVAGTVYSLAGVLLGSAVAFSLAKRFGRPLVERLLHEDVMTRFDGFVDRVGIPGLLAFVLIPGLPDDAICFLSGLTTWRLRTFLAVIIVGRFPAYVITVYAGGELANGQVTSALVLISAVILFSVIGYQKQDAIRELIQQMRS